MLLKAVGQPVSTDRRVYKNRWEMPKGYWKASGQFFMGIGKPREMPKYPLLANRRGVRIAQQLGAKAWKFPYISSKLLRFCLHLLKVEEAVENF
jgi:hypothetical protein